MTSDSGTAGPLGIKHAETLGQGDRLVLSANDLAAVKKSLESNDSQIGGWVMDVMFGHTKFGEYGATPAFSAFAGAWQAELAALEGALRELSGKIGAGSHTLHGTDVHTADAIAATATGLPRVQA